MEEESKKFLSRIFDLLSDGKVFETRSDELKSIVDFRYPQELQVIKNYQ